MTSNGAHSSRMQLLERVSISNLVDIFSRAGRKKFITALFAQSELVEPTYEEVRFSLSFSVLRRPKEPSTDNINAFC